MQRQTPAIFMPTSLLRPKRTHRAAPWCGTAISYALAICLASSVAVPSVLAKSKKGGYPTLNPLFEEPSDTDLLIGLGLTAVSLGISAISGGFTSAVTSFGIGSMTGQFAQTATNLGVHTFGFSPGTSQILGYAAAGALTGAVTNYAGFSGGTNGLSSSLGSFGSGSSIAYDALMGGAKGALVGASTYGAYELLNDTDFYQKNPILGNQLASFIGGTAGHFGFAAF